MDPMNAALDVVAAYPALLIAPVVAVLLALASFVRDRSWSPVEQEGKR